MKINLIYGTETGFTKSIGEDILRLFPDDETRLIKVDEAATEDWRADLLILGAPTWCEPRLDTFGEYSDDWNETELSNIDFKDSIQVLLVPSLFSLPFASSVQYTLHAPIPPNNLVFLL